ncbi:pre-mRNA-splicing factor ATP-dependent RNA helicase [Aphelenchoides avenae]|nr:pre-mRNA-splicing factor ATP-dependent RNA helicase [Aphelenchus avenae]
MSTRNKVEITRSDLAETLLQMCKLNIPDVLDYEFMQKPSEQYFIRAFDDLVAIGAIDAKLQEITPHGTKNALLRAAEYGCVEEMEVIVALISVGHDKVFYKPLDKAS